MRRFRMPSGRTERRPLLVAAETRRRKVCVSRRSRVYRVSVSLVSAPLTIHFPSLRVEARRLRGHRPNRAR